MVNRLEESGEPANLTEFRESDAEYAIRCTGVETVYIIERAIDAGERIAESCEHLVCEGGRTHLATYAFKQGIVEVPPQPAQSLTNCRLRYEQPLGGNRQASCLMDGHEHSNQVQVHVTPFNVTD